MCWCKYEGEFDALQDKHTRAHIFKVVDEEIFQFPLVLERIV